MATDNNKISGTSDEDLRAIFRAASNEAVPKQLNARVIRDANLELRGDKNRSWFLPWQRSAAFAAMVSLSLAVVLEMNEISIFEANPFAVPDVERGFAVEAVDGSMRMREIGETAAHLSLGEDPASAVNRNESSVCDSQQTTTPEAWLKCIVQLRADGLGAVADAELETLKLTFPEFFLAP